MPPIVAYLRDLDYQDLDETNFFIYSIDLPKEITIKEIIDRIKGVLKFDSINHPISKEEFMVGRNEYTVLGFSETENQKSDLIFIAYEFVNDDVIRPFKNEEKTNDLKAQIHGLLLDWKRRKVINDYKEKRTEVGRVLGKITPFFQKKTVGIPSLNAAKDSVVLWTRNHPLWAAVILTAIIQAIREIILRFLFPT